jgi:nitrous oxidase accessory protein NosD
MGIFGKKPVKGISEYELKEHGNKLSNQLHSVFNSHSKNIRDQKRAILDSALGLAGDRDANMSSSQKGGTIQTDEFESVVGGFEKKGIFSKDEASRLRAIARDALKD